MQVLQDQAKKPNVSSIGTAKDAIAPHNMLEGERYAFGDLTNRYPPILSAPAAGSLPQSLQSACTDLFYHDVPPYFVLCSVQQLANSFCAFQQQANRLHKPQRSDRRRPACTFVYGFLQHSLQVETCFFLSLTRIYLLQILLQLR